MLFKGKNALDEFSTVLYRLSMDARRLAFDAYANHPWHHKAFKRLTAAEIALAHAFIEQHAHLGRGAFELAVNRMFIDKPDKPKHFTIILDMLTCANIAAGK